MTPNPYCDLSRIYPTPEALALWADIGNTARPFDRGVVFSPAATELRDWGLIFRPELGPKWLLYRTPRGMSWAREEMRSRFIEAARELGADEDEATFKAKLGAIARQKAKGDVPEPPEEG